MNDERKHKYGIKGYCLLLATLLTVGCTEQTDSPLGDLDDTPRFVVTVVDGDGTRAPYLGANDIQSFSLYTLDGKSMSKSSYDYVKIDEKWTQEGKSWSWSKKNAMKFFALTPSFAVCDEVRLNKTERSFVYSVPSDGSQQVDLMFCNLLDQTKANTGGTITLMFKHALTYLGFKAKNSIGDARVIVKGIIIHNAVSTGTFTYDENTTSAGNWALGSARNVKGSNMIFSAEMELTNKYRQLNDANDYLVLLPQTLSPWVTSEESPVSLSTARTQGLSFAEIICKIYSTKAGEEGYVAGQDADKATDDDPEWVSVYYPFPFTRKSTAFSLGKVNNTLKLDFTGGYNDEGLEFLKHNAKKSVVVSTDNPVNQTIDVESDWDDPYQDDPENGAININF